jgi:hypothetical protein
MRGAGPIKFRLAFFNLLPHDAQETAPRIDPKF